jgi:hypothetical protein
MTSPPFPASLVAPRWSNSASRYSPSALLRYDWRGFIRQLLIADSGVRSSRQRIAIPL